MAKRSRAAWTKLVREWRESGLTAGAFAMRRQIRPKTLLWWGAKLRREAAAVVRPIEFIEVAAPLVGASERFEVHLPNGRWVAVPTAFDEAALARLLPIVEGGR